MILRAMDWRRTWTSTWRTSEQQISKNIAPYTTNTIAFMHPWAACTSLQTASACCSASILQWKKTKARTNVFSGKVTDPSWRTPNKKLDLKCGSNVSMKVWKSLENTVRKKGPQKKTSLGTKQNNHQPKKDRKSVHSFSRDLASENAPPLAWIPDRFCEQTGFCGSVFPWFSLLSKLTYCTVCMKVKMEFISQCDLPAKPMTTSKDHIFCKGSWDTYYTKLHFPIVLSEGWSTCYPVPSLLGYCRCLQGFVCLSFSCASFYFGSFQFTHNSRSWIGLPFATGATTTTTTTTTSTTTTPEIVYNHFW